MDGARVRDYLESEVASLLARFRQFETLLPAKATAGAAHRGEDGHYVEALLRHHLRRLLPQGLIVTSGFILRPAVRTGMRGWERRGTADTHSSQLDVIVFDFANYPMFEQFDEVAILPPEGVVAIVSVKKTLRTEEIRGECAALCRAATLSYCLDHSGASIRGPFTALLAMTASNADGASFPSRIFDQVRHAYPDPLPLPFDATVNLVSVVTEGSLFKPRPVPADETIASAAYKWKPHRDKSTYLALQFLLNGILSVYYDPTRNHRRRPGLLGFESYPDVVSVGEIPVSGLRLRG